MNAMARSRPIVVLNINESVPGFRATLTQLLELWSPGRRAAPNAGTLVTVRFGPLLGVLSLLALSSGCVPIPFLSPPVRATFNPGIMKGEVLAKHSDGPLEQVSPYLSGRFGAYPLGLVRSLARRPADFALGYVVEGTVIDDSPWTLAQGPYVEVAYHPWQRHWRSGHFARLRLFATGDLLFGAQLDDELGGGVTAGVGIEWGQWVADPFAATSRQGKFSAVLGYAQGEGTVGAELIGGFRKIGDERWWLVSFGLSFRIPATLGVWLVQIDP